MESLTNLFEWGLLFVLKYGVPAAVTLAIAAKFLEFMSFGKKTKDKMTLGDFLSETVQVLIIGVVAWAVIAAAYKLVPGVGSWIVDQLGVA